MDLPKILSSQSGSSGENTTPTGGSSISNDNNAYVGTGESVFTAAPSREINLDDYYYHHDESQLGTMKEKLRSDIGIEDNEELLGFLETAKEENEVFNDVNIANYEKLSEDEKIDSLLGEMIHKGNDGVAGNDIIKTSTKTLNLEGIAIQNEDVEKEIDFDDFWLKKLGGDVSSAQSALSSNLDKMGMSADEVLEKINPTIDNAKYEAFIKSNELSDSSESKLIFLGNDGQNGGNAGGDKYSFTVEGTGERKSDEQIGKDIDKAFANYFGVSEEAFLDNSAFAYAAYKQAIEKNPELKDMNIDTSSIESMKKAFVDNADKLGKLDIGEVAVKFENVGELSEGQREKLALYTGDEIKAAMTEDGSIDVSKIPNDKIQEIIGGEFVDKFDKLFSDGVLANMGDMVLQACEEKDVDPYLIAAIIAQETGCGTSSAIRKQNNPGGIMGSNGLRTFGSLQEGIEYMANLIAKYYIGEGRTTIEQIGNKYCPVGAANDPTGLNNYWQPNVTDYYNKLTGGNIDRYTSLV